MLEASFAPVRCVWAATHVRPPSVGDVAPPAVHLHHVVRVGWVDRDAGGHILVELAVAGGHVVGLDVEGREPRIGVERRPPGLARVIRTVRGRLVRRLDAGVGVEGIDHLRLDVGREDPVVLGNAVHRPLVGGLGVHVDPGGHRRLPALAAVRRAIDPAGVLAVHDLAGNGAVQEDRLVRGARPAANDRRPRQGRPADFSAQRRAAVVRPPDAFGRRRKADALLRPGWSGRNGRRWPRRAGLRSGSTSCRRQANARPPWRCPPASGPAGRGRWRSRRPGRPAGCRWTPSARPGRG